MSREGFRGRCFLLAQFETLAILYCVGEGLQVFSLNVTDCHGLLSGVSWLHVPEQVTEMDLKPEISGN